MKATRNSVRGQRYCARRWMASYEDPTLWISVDGAAFSDSPLNWGVRIETRNSRRVRIEHFLWGLKALPDWLYMGWFLWRKRKGSEAFTTRWKEWRSSIIPRFRA